MVHSIASTLVLIIFYVAIIFLVGFYTFCYWGEQRANVKAAAIGKEIEKAERWFDLKMAESLLEVQSSVARVEALIANRPFLSNHELMVLNLADKLLAAPESCGLEAKLETVSKMMEMIPSGGGRNSAGMVQSGVERDNDGAPSTPAGDVTPSSSVRLPPVLAGRASIIFFTIYMYIKELISNFTLVVLGEHGANVNVAATSKEIEKAEWWFDLKMTQSMLAVQASLACIEALIADRTFMSNHELLFMNLMDKLLAALESVGLEAKLKTVSKMIEIIQLSRGRNSARMVQSGVGRDNDGAPSTHVVLV
ncbi:hypothetical protein ACLOJK_016288 [Asimina triloba]